MTDERRFPVLRHSRTWSPASIPWRLIAPHEEQAKRNHAGQDLETLARRCGLDPREIYCVMHDRPWNVDVSMEDAIEFLKTLDSPGESAP